MVHHVNLVKILLILFLIVMLPIEVKAYEFNNVDFVESGYITSFAKNKTDSSACKDDSAILGNVKCETSVAWLLQRILNYIKILGPSLAIVLSSIDYTKAIVTSDSDSMKKTNKRFINRLVAAVLLFFVPMLTELILGILGITSSTAGLK